MSQADSSEMETNTVALPGIQDHSLSPIRLQRRAMTVASRSTPTSTSLSIDPKKLKDTAAPIITPRTKMANSVNVYNPKASEVSSLFEKYKALVPSCVVNKYLCEARNNADQKITTPLEISAYAESYWGAVLFADISGFSKLAEKLQNELGEGAAAAETLSRYVGKSLDIMVKLITSNNGDVIKFAGDAILAVFPASSF